MIQRFGLRVWGVQFFALIVVIVILFAFHVTHQQSIIERAQVNTAINTSEILASRLAEQMSQNLKPAHELDNLYLLDTQLLSFDEQTIPKAYLDIARQTKIQNETISTISATEIIVAFPIKFQQQTLGYGCLVIKKMSVGLELNVVLTLLFCVIVVGLMSFALLQKITEPLGTLNDATRLIAQSERKQAPIIPNTGDEIEELATSIGALLDGIERMREMRSEFMANMSHELRTPMHAILGFIETLLNDIDKMSKSEQIEILKIVNDSSKRLLSIINSLLDLSKFVAGKMHFSLAKVDIKQVTLEVLGQASPLFREKQIHVELDIEDGRYFIAADKEKIMQVIWNVLANAIKFSDHNKKVKISCQEMVLSMGRRREDKGSTDAIALFIEDEGPGIPEHELDDIFSPFIQSSKTQTGAGGTGLGLAICREIIIGHRGKMWAENIPPTGAKFIIAVPKYTSDFQQRGASR